MLPPGQYLVVPEPTDKRMSNPVPQKITINYDGTIVRDNNIVLKKDGAYVPYGVTFNDDFESYLNGSDRYIKVKIAGQSSLSKTISRLIQKRYADDILQNLEPLQGPSNDGYTYYKAPGQSAQSYHDTCQALQARNVSCTVIVRGGVNI